jgi:hypothetical protein
MVTLEQWAFQYVLATSTDASERIIVNVGHTKFWERIGNKIKIEKKNRKIDDTEYGSFADVALWGCKRRQTCPIQQTIRLPDAGKGKHCFLAHSFKSLIAFERMNQGAQFPFRMAHLGRLRK